MFCPRITYSLLHTMCIPCGVGGEVLDIGFVELQAVVPAVRL